MRVFENSIQYLLLADIDKAASQAMASFAENLDELDVDFFNLIIVF